QREKYAVPIPIDRRTFLKLGASAASAHWASQHGWSFVPRPLPQAAPAKRILIIGAGLAGLVAGYELTQAGHDVIILEAKLRPGGHVLTLREPFSDGLYADAGAARIPDHHDLTLQYVQQFGLTLVPFYPATLTKITLNAGKPISTPSGQHFQPSQLPWNF